jgi:hypothetical protein
MMTQFQQGLGTSTVPDAPTTGSPMPTPSGSQQTIQLQHTPSSTVSTNTQQPQLPANPTTTVQPQLPANPAIPQQQLPANPQQSQMPANPQQQMQPIQPTTPFTTGTTLSPMLPTLHILNQPPTLPQLNQGQMSNLSQTYMPSVSQSSQSQSAGHQLQQRTGGIMSNQPRKIILESQKLINITISETEELTQFFYRHFSIEECRIGTLWDRDR